MPNSLHRFPFKRISHWGFPSQKSPANPGQGHQSRDCHRPWPCIPAPEASPPGGCRWSHCHRSPRPCRSPRAQGFPRLHLQPDHLEVAKEKGDPWRNKTCNISTYPNNCLYCISYKSVCTCSNYIIYIICLCVYIFLFIYLFMHMYILLYYKYHRFGVDSPSGQRFPAGFIQQAFRALHGSAPVFPVKTLLTKSCEASKVMKLVEELWLQTWLWRWIFFGRAPGCTGESALWKEHSEQSWGKSGVHKCTRTHNYIYILHYIYIYITYPYHIWHIWNKSPTIYLVEHIGDKCLHELRHQYPVGMILPSPWLILDT